MLDPRLGLHRSDNPSLSLTWQILIVIYFLRFWDIVPNPYRIPEPLARRNEFDSGRTGSIVSRLALYQNYATQKPNIKVSHINYVRHLEEPLERGNLKQSRRVDTRRSLDTNPYSVSAHQQPTNQSLLEAPHTPSESNNPQTSVSSHHNLAPRQTPDSARLSKTRHTKHPYPGIVPTQA